ncbi:MAG TPA: hypothetical protein VFV63_16095 [Ilumatobacteraceae bacterium]|nr:hypothetical protein [Ilumatobacteraceae bacterium]
MTLVRLARSVGFALAFLILAVSGVYVVIDLARWEWNRAIISALVFLSSLVVLVAMMLFRQLHRLEMRMGALEHQRRDVTDVLGTLRATNVAGAGQRFRWLEQSPDRLTVFVPVLLGAGVVLSFVAYLIERIGGAFAASALDPRTARELAPDLPLGTGIVEPVGERALREPVRRPAARAVALVVTVVLAVVLVQGLRELTQSRPGELTAPGATTIVVDIGQRRQIRPLEVVATDLWSTCRSRLPGPLELVAITPTVGERVRLDLDRALGHTGRARIVGCLEDYTLDLVQADVVSIDSSPSPVG